MLTLIHTTCGQGLIMGTATDTKPDVPDGTVYLEKDTFTFYLKENGVWVEKFKSPKP